MRVCIGYVDVDALGTGFADQAASRAVRAVAAGRGCRRITRFDDVRCGLRVFDVGTLPDLGGVS